MNNKEYVRHLAIFLVANGTTMTGEDLASHLNWNKFKTSYNSEYAGGRGTYTLIHATYDWLVSNGNMEDAEKVALAYKKADGSYAYEK